MSILKTSGLLTTVLIGSAADLMLPNAAEAEPAVGHTFPAAQPLIVPPAPQPLLPPPVALPVLQHSQGETIRTGQGAFNAGQQGISTVQESTGPAAAPASLPPLTETAIEIGVEPAPLAPRGAVVEVPTYRPLPPLPETAAEAISEPVTETVAEASPTPSATEGTAEAIALNPADSAEKSDLLTAVAAEPAAPQTHRGWFDRQLAQTTAQRKSQREAQLRENLLRTAQEYVVQNNIAAAQQIAQNPVFLDAERTALQQAIAVRHRPTGTLSPAEPETPLAQDVARLAARQSWLLERLPAAPSPAAPAPPSVAPSSSPSSSSSLPSSSANCQVESAAPLRVNCSSPMLTGYQWLLEAANRASQSSGMPLASAARVSSRYGWRIHPIYGDRRFHAGVDFAAPTGTPVYASLSGYVRTSEYLNGYGYTVIVENGMAEERHLYAHLSAMTVRPGQWVNQGDMVGRVGSTGNSTGPHLHFEIRRWSHNGWATVDPLSVNAQAAR